MDKEVYIEIAQKLGIEARPDLTEDEMMVILTHRVNQLLETDKDLLMSFLYRLDISQKKIASVLRVTNIIPPEQSLARLILDRQIERVRTKKKYRQDPIEGWEF